MIKYETIKRGPDAAEAYLAIMRLSFDEAAVARKAVALPWLLGRHPPGHPTGSFFQTLERDGEVVGGMVMLADGVWLDGVERPAFLPMGIHVHPDHRGRGIRMLKAAYNVASEGAVFGIPNDLHFGIHMRFGAVISGVRTVRFRPYGVGATLMRRYPKIAPIAPAVNAASVAFGKLVDLAAPRLRRREQIEPLDRFDADFDGFWCAARRSHSFLCVRSAERMQWRYREAPFCTYAVDVLRRGGAIVGMIVSRIADHNGRKIGQVSDILCAEPDPRDYALLLDAASRRFGAAGVEFAEYAFIGHAELDAAGRRAGYWFPRKHRRVAAHGNGPRDADAVTRQIGDLHFLRGDHDEDY